MSVQRGIDFSPRDVKIKNGNLKIEENIDMGDMTPSQNNNEVQYKENYLNYGQEDQMFIVGYKEQKFFVILTRVFSIATLGLLPLFLFWKPTLKLRLYYKEVPLKNAEVVYLKDQYSEEFIERVKMIKRLPQVLHEVTVRGGEAIEEVSVLRNILGDVMHSSKYFENKKLKYIWIEEKKIFQKLKGLEEQVKCRDLHQAGGLSSTDHEEMMKIFGVNLIDVPLTPYWKLLFKEGLNPLYFFQLFSVVLWFCDNYYYFASIILIISVFILGQSVFEIRSNQKLLKDKIHPSMDVLVCRKDAKESEMKSSETLVPGDLLEIPKRGCMMQCDAVLISGDCIVNESLLTGESVPITKTPLPLDDDAFNLAKHSRHTLFSGTKVIQTRFYDQYKVYAVVIRTGFSTTKGELVRSIMFPKPMDLKFARDVYRFLFFLFIISSIGMLYTFVVMSLRGDKVWHMIVRALDLVTIVIPPTLPAALTTCVRLAESRLKRKRIYCLSLRSLNMCGVVEVFCFDKTGTLTEEGLDLKCLIPCTQALISPHKEFTSPQMLKPPPDVITPLNVLNSHTEVLLNADSVFISAPPTSTFPSSSISTPNDSKAVASSIISPPSKTLIPSTPSCSTTMPDCQQAFKLNKLDSTLSEESPIKELNSFGCEVEDIVTVMGEVHEVVVAMATCHSITIVDGCQMGDPLDLKMFEASKWEFVMESSYDDIVPTIMKPPSANNEEGSVQVGVVRVFPFSSNLQRMSVITRRSDVENRYDCYVKGSPEMVTNFCKKSSVPPNFHQKLSYYAQLGYRMIALAYKPLKKSYLKIQQLKREAVEKDLIFLGMLVFENRLKPQSTDVIKLLNTANIRTLMVTGDNIQTALSVARKCSMLPMKDHAILVSIRHRHLNEASSDHVTPATCTDSEDTKPHLFALDKSIDDDIELSLCQNIENEFSTTNGKYHYIVEGKTWAFIRKNHPEFLKKLAINGTVFARFLPEQKQQLVEVLQEEGNFVGMCGDGANDCGALKTAHTGISLSEAEASVASPFTSNEANITCVVKIIREGRAALVSSSGNFRFLAGYSLTQFVSICLLYWVGASFTDFIFLYIDLVLIFSLSYTFNRTGACKQLSNKPPSIALLTPAIVLSILFQLVLNTFFQVSLWALTTKQPWFVPFVDNEHEVYKCHEVTAVFLISSFQYIILAVVFSKGAPYRKSMFTNIWFMVSIVVGLLLGVYFTFYPANWIINLMELAPPVTIEFKVLIITMSLLNLVLNFFVEYVFIEWLSTKDRKKTWQRFTSLFHGRKLNYPDELGTLKPPPHEPNTFTNISQYSFNTVSTTVNKAIDADENLLLIDEVPVKSPEIFKTKKKISELPLLEINNRPMQWNNSSQNNTKPHVSNTSPCQNCNEETPFVEKANLAISKL